MISAGLSGAFTVTDSRKESGPAPTTQELRERAEATREQLGETVEALAAKADVKAPVHEGGAAKHQVSEKTAPVRDTVLRNRTWFLAAAGATGALLVFLAVRGIRG
ncbi:DUF3618 domain-containing protein [Streptomyces sp. NPDC059373]